MKIKLNLGCGSHTPSNWINVDYALGVKLAKVPLLSKFGITQLKWDKNIFLHNLLTPFPWETNSVDIIYSSHTLEHFTREDGYRFLKECHRVLRPDGIIRIVVPDLKLLVYNYLNGKLRADSFIESLRVLYPPLNHFLRRVLSPYTYFPHKCMYDAETLLIIMHEIGFNAFARNGFESEIEDIQNIEALDRTKDSVIVEGRKK